MQERSRIFLAEAKACGLDVYPYKEGFFVTLRIPDNALRDRVHACYIENHIYTVRVNKGIRVAVCSLPVSKVRGLAQRMKALKENVKEG
jgi:aspartate aminotransferase/aromatic-amino-acid transaminase